MPRKTWAGGKFQDDPEKRAEVWQTAPRAKDKYGNDIIMVGNFWCSYDYNRFRELIENSNPDHHLIMVRISDGRIFSRTAKEFQRMKSLPLRFKSKWYAFIDPITQNEIYV